MNDLVSSSVLLVKSDRDALEHLSSVIGMEETVTDEVIADLKQKDLSLMIDSKAHAALLDITVTPREKARLLSVLLPHAGDWL